MRSIVLTSLIAIVGLALGATVSSATPTSPRTGLFQYDRSAPLDVVYGVTVTRQAIVRQELSYQATPSLRLKASFVHPVSGGPWTLVIWSPGMAGARRQQLP